MVISSEAQARRAQFITILTARGAEYITRSKSDALHHDYGVCGGGCGCVCGRVPWRVTMKLPLSATPKSGRYARQAQRAVPPGYQTRLIPIFHVSLGIESVRRSEIK